MKKCKVGIIGHFGFGSDLANGQTIKTKIVAEEINEITREASAMWILMGVLRRYSQLSGGVLDYFTAAIIS